MFGALQHLDRFGACSPVFLNSHAAGIVGLYQYCLDGKWQFTPEQRKSLRDMQCSVEMFSGLDTISPDKIAAQIDPANSTAAVTNASMPRELPSEFLAKFKACLSSRTSHFVLVLDGVADASNVAGIFRTAESLGVLHVWIVSPWERHRAPGTADNLRQIAAVSKKVYTLRKHIFHALSYPFSACRVNSGSALGAFLIQRHVQQR